MEEKYKRLHRVRDGKVLMGLMAGLGEYFHLDPILFRFAAIALMFLSPWGLSVLVLYFVFALCIPYGKAEQK